MARTSTNASIQSVENLSQSEQAIALSDSRSSSATPVAVIIRSFATICVAVKRMTEQRGESAHGRACSSIQHSA